MISMVHDDKETKKHSYPCHTNILLSVLHNVWLGQGILSIPKDGGLATAFLESNI